MATVLCTGIHEGTTTTRKLILEDAGHTVVTAMSSPEIIAACQDFKFDVAVVGEDGHSRTSLEWAALIREHCPDVKILEISAPHHGASVPSAHARLDTPEIAAKLAGRVAELSKQEAAFRNREQIRELCVEVLKAEKGAAFEAAISKLAAAVQMFGGEEDGDTASKTR